MKKNYDPLGNKSFSLAMKIVKLQKRLQAEEREYAISKQLFSAGTLTGVLIRESFSAQSDREFVKKFYKAKEHCFETIYWLEILHQSKLIEKQEFENLKNLSLEIIKMIASSIRTKKKNIK